jgi:carbohydrate-selective porin OprB
LHTRLWQRDYLTGDWSGTRTDLANHGVQLNVDWPQTIQGVVRSGLDLRV